MSIFGCQPPPLSPPPNRPKRWRWLTLARVEYGPLWYFILFNDKFIYAILIYFFPVINTANIVFCKSYLNDTLEENIRLLSKIHPISWLNMKKKTYLPRCLVILVGLCLIVSVSLDPLHFDNVFFAWLEYSSCWLDNLKNR